MTEERWFLETLFQYDSFSFLPFWSRRVIVIVRHKASKRLWKFIVQFAQSLWRKQTISFPRRRHEARMREVLQRGIKRVDDRRQWRLERIVSLSLSLSLAFLLFSGCIINKLYYAKKYLARYIQFMRGFSLGTYKRSWPTQETWNVATDGVPLGFEESNCKFT